MVLGNFHPVQQYYSATSLNKVFLCVSGTQEELEVYSNREVGSEYKSKE